MNKFFKILIITFIISFLITLTIRIQAIEISPWAGYGTLNMKEFNTWFHNTYDGIEDLFEWLGSTCNVKELTDGYVAGIDIGPLRLSYISAISAKFVLNDDYHYLYEPSILMFMLGLKYPENSGSEFYIGIYCGGAYAMLNNKYIPPSPSTGYTVPYSGSDIAWEVTLSGKLGPVFIGFSYRNTLIKKLTATEDVLDAGVEKGEVFQRSADNPIPLDYTGTTVYLMFKFGNSSGSGYSRYYR